MAESFSFRLHSARFTHERNLGGTGFRVDPHRLLHLDDNGIGMGGDVRGMPPMIGGGFLSPVLRSGVVPEASLRTACQFLDQLIGGKNPSRGTSLAALMNDAVVSYNSHEFSSSLVSAWTICEALLQDRWEKHLADVASMVPLTAKRRKFLLGRDFTASIVIENLAIAGKYPLDLYEQIGVSRNLPGVESAAQVSTAGGGTGRNPRPPPTRRTRPGCDMAARPA
ncbi:hypothetical protein [Micromonospora sp. NPDC005979]|uniref:hypothetical protein n=1 Tax=Micromonospora sp. NPDC005979 TaxID=3156726 RepID=UPI0033A9D5FD